MIAPLREIDLLGVYVAPFSLCLPIAFAATLIALAALRRAPALGGSFRSPWMELAMFTGILSALVLLLGRV
jgi:hypothetical protein